MNSAWTVASNVDFSQCTELFTDPQISFFINFFIKNGSRSTIYIFKNYFVTVISAISFQFQQNKFYPNIPLKRCCTVTVHVNILGFTFYSINELIIIMGKLFPMLNSKNKIWRGYDFAIQLQCASPLTFIKVVGKKENKLHFTQPTLQQTLCNNHHFSLMLRFCFFFLKRFVHDDILWSQLCKLGKLLCCIPFSYVWFTSFTLLLPPYT